MKKIYRLSLEVTMAILGIAVNYRLNNLLNNGDVRRLASKQKSNPVIGVALRHRVKLSGKEVFKRRRRDWSRRRQVMGF